MAIWQEMKKLGNRKSISVSTCIKALSLEEWFALWDSPRFGAEVWHVNESFEVYFSHETMYMYIVNVNPPKGLQHAPVAVYATGYMNEHFSKPQ